MSVGHDRRKVFHCGLPHRHPKERMLSRRGAMSRRGGSGPLDARPAAAPLAASFLERRKEQERSFLIAGKISRDLLRLKLDEALAAPITPLTARDVRVPEIAGKAMAVIGVRRGGKTSFLQRHVAERIAGGRPRESQLLLSLEDERLVGMTAADLGWVLEEHERRAPGLRESGALCVYLDEVQSVAGWETLVRRLIDAGGIEIFVSGSSAKLLSREVATALRRYLREGGFPEAQGTERRDRLALLKRYVDVMVLRDVIERHDVTNTQALRWLQRHLLATPGGKFSVKKLYDSLRSQGVPVAKDTLYVYLDHLEDGFLVRTVSMHSTSERQRMANPRKAYPIDPGLIPLYERVGRAHRGRALETAVLLELERRGYGIDWLRTRDEGEVDFFAERTGDPPLLIQVSLETAADDTWERGVRALESAARAYPEAEALLVTLDSSPPTRDLPGSIEWRSASRWLLEPDA